MIAIAFRIDIIQGIPSHEKMEKFLDHYPKYLGGYEIAEKTKKPHYQGILWVEDEDAYKAAKTRWSEYFSKTHPGSAKSFPLVRKLENYEAYIVKDDDIRFRKNYDSADVESLKALSYKKGDPKKRESTALLPKVLEEFDIWRSTQNLKGDTYSEEKVVEWLTTTFFNHQKLFDTNVIVKYRNYLMMKIDKRYIVEKVSIFV